MKSMLSLRRFLAALSLPLSEFIVGVVGRVRNAWLGTAAGGDPTVVIPGF